jgi:hypothetical protein
MLFGGGIFGDYWMVNKRSLLIVGGHHGRDRTVVGFTTTYSISAYHL